MIICNGKLCLLTEEMTQSSNFGICKQWDLAHMWKWPFSVSFSTTDWNGILFGTKEQSQDTNT